MQKNLCLLLVLMVMMSCGRKEEKVARLEHLTSFSQVEMLFSDPPTQFRPVPLWVWNGVVTREMIAEQMKDLKEKGFGGVFIHPRPGLITEYLSPDWFAMVKYTVDMADSLGMKVWLYDEDSYSSGFAGGHVPAEMPESYNEGCALRVSRTPVLKLDPDKTYKHIFIRRDNKLHEITQELPSFMGKGGDFFLFESVFYARSGWHAGYSYVDLLKEGVTKKFMQITMDGYEKSVGDRFGTTLPGIFTDEPTIAPEWGQATLRWTPDLYSSFEKQNGYDLRPEYLSLLWKTGDWKKVRHDYYATLLDMFIDRWAKPWYEYTEKKNLRWTGHYWEHEWPYPVQGPDNMAMYAWQQQPAIDMLFNTQHEYPEQFGNIRSVKELASVANQAGRTRAMSETFGASGWELTFGDMKRNGDWEYALGVNFMDQHLVHQTLLGVRKFDHPESFSYHAPYWDVYKSQNDYFGRLSMALSSGDQVNKILIIEPTTTAWMYYEPNGANEELQRMRRSFHDLLTALEKYQVEYDLGSERIIRDEGAIKGKQFIIGKRNYDLVVLPPGLENLEGETAELLMKYVDNGGVVLACGNPPSFIDGSASEKIVTLARQKPGAWHMSFATELPKILADKYASDFIPLAPESWGGQVFHHRRTLDDGQLVFLANYDQTRVSRGVFRIRGQSAVCLDALTGEIKSYPSAAHEGTCEVSFVLPPAGSLLLFISSGKMKGSYPAWKQFQVVDTLRPSGEIKVRRLAENVITLDYCYLKQGNKPEKLQYFFPALEETFRYYGWKGDPWFVAVQFRKNIVESDTFPAGSGYKARFPFNVEAGTGTAGMKAVVERPELFNVRINGKEVKALPGQWWLDKAFGVYDIGPLVKDGENDLSVEVSPMSVFAELQPVYLLGDFSVIAQSKGWKITPRKSLHLGSWKDQGLPFYSKGVEYQSKFNKPRKKANYSLHLGEWNGTVAKVIVNDKSAGLIISPPYELDISRFLSKGKNDIRVQVYGSNKNLLGPHHMVSERGNVIPWNFYSAPVIQPAGEKYDLVDYGLMTDYFILRLKEAKK